MLTGDKLETATCIAKSSRLVSRTQGLHVFKSVVTRTDAHLELNTFRKKHDCALVISGDSLEVSESKQGYSMPLVICETFTSQATWTSTVVFSLVVVSTAVALYSVMGTVLSLHSLYLLYPLTTDRRTGRMR
jgi:hypothetical protein